MLKKLLFILIVLQSSLAFTQALPTFNMKDTTIDDCDGILKDSDDEFGGRYAANENFIFTICPGPGGQIIFDFSFLMLEPVYDSIRIYDGADTNGIFLGGWTGQPTTTPTLIASSGCITIHFTSDGTLQLNGWEATWQTVAPPVIPPVMTTATTSPPTCDSSSFIIDFDKNVHCDSLYASAFILTGANAPTITNVAPINCSSDSTTSARITLATPILYNCNYTLDFNLNILDICDSLWQFVLTDNFSITNCKIPYQMPPNDTICIGNCGSVEVLPVPGCSPLTYLWDNGLSATAGPHVVCPTTTTTYRVTITETTTGNIANDSITIFVQDSINTNITMSLSNGNGPQCGSNLMNVVFTPSISCNLLDSGYFDFISGGIAPTVTNMAALNCTNGLLDSVQLTLSAPFSGNCNYTINYNWNFTHQCTGPQSFVYTDSFAITGCPLYGTINAPDTICENSCDSIGMVINGCSTYDYVWSNGWPNAPGPFQICPTGDTTIYVTVTENPSGLTYTDSVTITVIPLGIDLSYTFDPLVNLNCQSDSIVVLFNTPVNCNSIDDSSFTISGGNTAPNVTNVYPTNCISGQTNRVVIKLDASFTYNCKYLLNFKLDTVDWCGDTVKVTNEDTLFILDCPLDYRLAYTQELCKDLCTYVRVDQYESCFGYSFNWSNGWPDTNGMVICPDADTTWYVTITENVTGITVQDSVIIRIDSSFNNFNMLLDSSTYIPACDSLILQVKFTNPVHCDSIYTSAFQLRGVGAPNIPIANITPINCNLDSALGATITLSTPLVFGTDYRLYFFVNGNDCATNKNIRNIRIEPHASDFSVSDTCYYAQTNFNVVIDSLGDLDSVIWNFDDPTSGNNSSTALSVTHEFSTPGDYDVTLYAFFACEIDTIIKTITISPPLVVDIAGRLTVCSGVTTTLDAGVFNTYQWSTGDITQTTTISAPTSYSVIVSDGSGCRTGRDTVTVTHIPDLTPAIAGPTSYCPGTGTTLDAGVFDSYLWSTGGTTQTMYTNTPGTYSVIVYDTLGCPGYDTAIVQLGSNLPTQITGVKNLCPGTTTILDAGNDYVLYQWSTGDTIQALADMGVGTYFVYVKDSIGCSGYDTITVNMYPKADLSITGDTIFCLGYFGTLNATVGYNGYTWNDGSRSTSLTVSKEGLYSVRVLDQNVCWAYDTVFVTTDTCIDTCNVIIPNAFTPNEDGVNDTFGPTVSKCEFESFDMKIFDRWGILIFETDNVETPWDGNYKESIVENDMYVWQITYKSINDPRTKTRMGHVSVIK